ncbi:hypothetical protein GGC65_001173 [Sphingopyxis sp. OAS728]|uniref:hypothetical protein n=1 Tax=Sphingopyxis sp. OAS728 TaxID=2663823 RepID=UPI00178B70F8|nr:hypothetical protein [Sphingopyxis sp. OAS728]MBE1526717.1 hypothetical protein [Sphingopyxis sp. OAS728]
MLDPNSLKIVAAICSVAGSVVLAWRVKRILDALALIVTAHELNIQQLMPGYKGDIYNLANSTEHANRAKGTSLLVVGFGLLGLSGALNLLAFLR